MRGATLAVCSAVFFGLTTPAAKGLLGSVDPQLLAGLFYLGSGVGLWVFWWVARHDRARLEAPLGREDRLWLLAAIGLGGVVAPPVLLAGLRRTPAGTAALLLNLEGVFTPLLAWAALGEHVHRRTVAGLALILGGTALLSWEAGTGGGSLGGCLLIALACLAWAIDNNLTQRVSGGDPVQVAGSKGLVGGTVNVLLGLSMGSRLPGAPTVLAAMAIGLVGYGLSLVLFVRSLRELGVARTSAYFSLSPFVGSTAGVLLFQEPITARWLAAMAAMAAGTWLSVTEEHGHAHAHDAMTHEHGHVHEEHHRHAHAPDDPPGEPHSHVHRHEPMIHTHPHYPDLHHRHSHDA